jgi:GNAT superfamily N-acetyltransferase
MNIDYLAEHRAFIPALSEWFLQEWRDYYGDKTWEDIASTFYQRLNRSRVPLALVAFEGDRPLGTVSLLEESISTRKHLAPWLGGLYVREDVRRHGIGKQLIEAAAGEARGLGIKQLFIGIRKAEDYYSKLGWEMVERVDYYGEAIAIMRLDLRRGEA